MGVKRTHTASYWSMVVFLVAVADLVTLTSGSRMAEVPPMLHHQNELIHEAEMARREHQRHDAALKLEEEKILRVPLILSRKRVSLQEEATYAAEENNLHGKPGQGYYIEVEIGTPPQLLDVLVDTGSSNFAVAAAENPDVVHYFQVDDSSTFEDENVYVYVPYTQGDWGGELGSDVISIVSLPNSTVRANIATITESSNFFINGSHWEGILGMAYADIARPDSSVEPFFDSLVSQAGISNVFSMQLCGDMNKDDPTGASMGGTMIFGGVDSSLYTGEIQYAYINKEWYYEVILTDIKVAGDSLEMDCKEYNFDKTIVDSGTTNLRLPTKVFAAFAEAVKANTNIPVQNPPPGFWTGEEVLCWTEGTIPWDAFPTVTFSMAASANTTFDLDISPAQYLRAVGDEYDLTESDDCYKFAVANSDTGTVLGAVLMEGFYVVFDRAEKRVGFAQTSCDNRPPGAAVSTVGAPYAAANTSACAYIKPESNQSTLMVVAYVMVGICILCLIPLVLMVAHWQITLCRQKRWRREEELLFSDTGS